MKPFVSVIVCTHNPRPVLLDWALASIEAQTLERDRFEVIVVDNCSRAPLEVERLHAQRDINITLVREPALGLANARCAGIQRAQADLFVFVDDDNFLMPDYLDRAIAIAAREPEIGHFGGIAMPLYEEPVSSWQKRFLPSLGIRDEGAEPITSYENHWGAWEPIGAGMVSRRAVAEAFVETVRTNELAQLLGRKGSHLMSGEDTLFARIAASMGYACSYQPALKLFHFIRRNRLRPATLARTILGHGRSYVILEELSRRKIAPESLGKMVWELALCVAYHSRKEGLRAGLIQWFWNLGAFLQRVKQSPLTECRDLPKQSERVELSKAGD